MKGNEEIRDELSEVLKKECPLKSVLKKDKACPHAGPSGACGDCSYIWPLVVSEILDKYGAKRASYEREREKVKVLQAELESLKAQGSEQGRQRDSISDLVFDIARGVRALPKIGRELKMAFLEAMREGEDERRESVDESQGDEGGSEGD